MQPIVPPPMPASYPDDAELVTVANPNLTVAEAYWVAACQTLGIHVPQTPTAIRITRTDNGWTVRWREQGKRKQRTFDTPGQARDWRHFLMDTYATQRSRR